MNPRPAGTALIVVAVLGMGLTTGCAITSRPSAPTVSASPVPAAPSPSAHDDEGIGDAPSTAAAPQAVLTAQNYVRAWANPDLDQKTWLAGVTPYVTPEYRQLLTTVDPANVPARAVLGPATVESSTTAVVVTDVPTDAGTLRVTCANTGGRWLVATVEPPERPGE